MLKTFLTYLVSRLPFVQPSVRRLVNKHISDKLKEAEERAREDIEFHASELSTKLEKAFNEFVEGKEAAVKRQANAILGKLLN